MNRVAIASLCAVCSALYALPVLGQPVDDEPENEPAKPGDPSNGEPNAPPGDGAKPAPGPEGGAQPDNGPPPGGRGKALDEPPLEPKSDIEDDLIFRPRFRNGASLMYGAFIPGPVHLFGLEGRAGFQINDMMCVYSGAGGFLGFNSDVVGSDEDLSFERSFGGFIYAHLMFEVTFLETIFIALGPQIAFGGLVHEQAYSDTSQEEAGGHVSVFYGFLPGFKTRIGLGFGHLRKQFTFGFDAHVLFGRRFVAETTAGSSGVTVGAADGIAVGFLPSLFLGYDAK